MVWPLVAGNWKMNGLGQNLSEVAAVSAHIQANPPMADVLLCLPATLIGLSAARGEGSLLAIGAEDCHANISGAHTGDISAEMLVDAGAGSIIVGHSERRTDHGETDEIVKAKAEAVLRAGATPIVCVGETEAERDAGQALAVVERQVRGSMPAGGLPDTVVVAYEPVWAIGTGRTPTLDEIAEVHAHLKAVLDDVGGSGPWRILYGGSVKVSNATEISAINHVGGALVGGASLTAQDFIPIIEAFSSAQNG